MGMLQSGPRTFTCNGCLSDFIRDGILKLHQVPTTQQVADIGTKALFWPLFCALLYIVVGLA
jgi:hypothetical protein